MAKKLEPKGGPKGTVRTTVDLPRPLWRALKIQAITEGRDLRRLMIAAAEQYLKAQKGGAQ